MVVKEEELLFLKQNGCFPFETISAAASPNASVELYEDADLIIQVYLMIRPLHTLLEDICSILCNI